MLYFRIIILFEWIYDNFKIASYLCSMYTLYLLTNEWSFWYRKVLLHVPFPLNWHIRLLLNYCFVLPFLKNYCYKNTSDKYTKFYKFITRYMLNHVNAKSFDSYQKPQSLFKINDLIWKLPIYELFYIVVIRSFKSIFYKVT